MILWPAMPENHFALSIEQLRELKSQLDAMLEDSASISRLLAAAHGIEDHAPFGPLK